MVLNSLTKALSQVGVERRILRWHHVRWSKPGADVFEVFPKVDQSL